MEEILFILSLKNWGHTNSMIDLKPDYMKCPFNCGCDKNNSIKASNQFIDHVIVPLMREIKKEEKNNERRPT